jgi:aryl-alcohol dehydrogenase-like predicted oxidoreductase
MREIAETKAVSVARLALAYVLSKPFVTSVIIGARDAEQLQDNLLAAEVSLAPEEIARLDEVSALPAEYPGWMLGFQGANRIPKPFEPKS